MRLSIATWNINSVRLRLDLVERFLTTWRPDVLCLQETKCANEVFPAEAFSRMGYPHQAINGQKGYHGVAIVSRLAFSANGSEPFCGKTDGRHVRVRLAQTGIDLHNLYVPAGGDVPDREVNVKFGHKLDFLEELAGRFVDPPARSILVGDLNVAPLEHDVWSHRQLLSVVSHTPVEVERLARAVDAGGWVDAARSFVSHGAKLYTWWSYRSPQWAASDRGRRLDHVWLTPDLAPHLASVSVLREARGWPRPSDHVPVTAVLEIED